MAYSDLRKCKWCGTEYHKNSGEGAYCTKKCAHEHKTNNPNSSSYSWLKLVGLLIVGGLVYSQYLTSDNSSGSSHQWDEESYSPYEAEEDDLNEDGVEYEEVDDVDNEVEEAIEEGDNDFQDVIESDDYITVGKLMAADDEIHGNANTGLDIEYNKVFNKEVYLLREVWYYMASNGCQILTIYSGDAPLEVVIFNNGNRVDRTSNYKKFMKAYFENESPITEIKIDGNRFRVSECDLNMDLNPNIYLLAEEQVLYCKGVKTTGHNQDNITFEDRLMRFSIVGAGVLGENVSKVILQRNDIKTMRRTSRAFYKGRFTSAHWNSWMDLGYKVFTTAQVSDEAYSYTVTIMSEHLSDQ